MNEGYDLIKRLKESAPKFDEPIERPKAESHEATERSNKIIEQLDTLDFSDAGKVLEWCAAFQESSDNVNVEHTVGDTNKILAKFAEHGYVPGMNMGAEGKEDKENYAKYIIGQALDGLETTGDISRSIHNFADDWKVKFPK